MTTFASPAVGWIDLTVEDAPRLRDFYSSVLGMRSSEVSMGDYADYCLHPGGDAEPVAGVCHARGGNRGLPPVWLPYFRVEDLEAALERCRQWEGTVLASPRAAGAQGRFAVIRDPAGACCALWQPQP